MNDSWRRNLWILWGGSLVASASYSMVVPFLPLFLGQIGVKSNVDTWSGIIFSAAFFGGAIVAPLWGALSDRYGRKVMIIRSGFALAAIYILSAFVQNPVELLALRVLMGLLSGYIPSATALIGTSTPTSSVGYAMGLMAVAGSTGTILGPLAGGAISHFFSYRESFVIAGLAVLVATLPVIFWVRETGFVPSRTRFDLRGDLRLAWHNQTLFALLVTTAMTQFAIMTIEPLLPLYVMTIGISRSDASLATGIVFSVLGVAGIIFTPMWGRLGDRRGFVRLLFIGMLGGSVGTLAQVFFHSIWTFGAIRFVYGAFFCAVFPAINALIVRVTPSDYRGRAFGLAQSANQVGTLVGPLVGGFIGDLYSIHRVFIVTSLLLFATTVYMLFVRRTLVRSEVVS
jgi:DHA1 family multidrug resistance protein-like MFS transporter